MRTRTRTHTRNKDNTYSIHDVGKIFSDVLKSTKSSCFCTQHRISVIIVSVKKPNVINMFDENERKEGNALFNDVRHMVKDHSDSEKGKRCRHMGYFSRLAARVLYYAPSHRQDSTYHGLCYTSCGALAGTRNSSMGPP